MYYVYHALQSNFCIKSGLIFGDAVGRSPKIWMNAFVILVWDIAVPSNSY